MVHDVAKENLRLEVERAGDGVSKAESKGDAGRVVASRVEEEARHRTEPEAAGLEPKVNGDAHPRLGGVIEKNGHIDAGIEPSHAAEMKSHGHAGHQAQAGI